MVKAGSKGKAENTCFICEAIEPNLLEIARAIEITKGSRLNSLQRRDDFTSSASHAQCILSDGLLVQQNSTEHVRVHAVKPTSIIKVYIELLVF